ncbi:MAG: hypothetical protein WCG99_04340 [Candidatus Berkelbacteria bacterium]
MQTKTIYCSNSIYGMVERITRQDENVTDDQIFGEVKDIKVGPVDGGFYRLYRRDEWQQVIETVRSRLQEKVK